MTLELRGLCWDHPRCTRPTAAAGAAHRTVPPDVTVTRDARPLARFSDQPAREVGGGDPIVADHPMTGVAAERGVLVPLDTILGGGTAARLEAAGLGPSRTCYVWAGHHGALRERAPAGRIVAELPEPADRHREPDTAQAGR